MLYAIWRACERLGLLPPGVPRSWDGANVLAQAQLLAYDQVRDLEDVKFQMALAGARPRV